MIFDISSPLQFRFSGLDFRVWGLHVLFDLREAKEVKGTLAVPVEAPRGSFCETKSNAFALRAQVPNNYIGPWDWGNST